ncbi:redoxin domain-containing protein [candidate division KSB1 bacterium]
MKRILVICFIALFAVSLFGFSGQDGKFALNGKVTGLKMKDLNGKDFDIEKVLANDDVKGVMFVFLSYKCPNSVSRNDRFIKHAADFKKKGVLFIGIDSNVATENAAGMKAYAEEKNFNFPIFWDDGNVIADRFDAKTTPHAFFVDKKSVLRYKGRIDDNPKDPAGVKDATIANVVDEYLAGKELSVTETRPDG